jgi:hypothetical protein
VQIKTYAHLVSPDGHNILVGFVEARTQDGFDIEIAARGTQGIVSNINLHTDVPEILRVSLDQVRKVAPMSLTRGHTTVESVFQCIQSSSARLMRSAIPFAMVGV